MMRLLFWWAVLPAATLCAVAEAPPLTVLAPKSSLTRQLAEEPLTSPQPSSALTNQPLRTYPSTALPPIVSPNLRPVTPGPGEAKELEMYQSQLELGRRLRQASDWEQAEACLARLMTMPAPLEFHRCALLELGLLAQDRRQLLKAQQIFSQYVTRFPEDPSTPEVLLRQGMLYREMGAPVLALSKFYAVMSSALNLKLDRLAYYQRMVLQAQGEIADTYYLGGKYEEAADYFKRLLKLDSPELNREEVHYKLVRSESAARRPAETVSQAQLFADLHPTSRYLAEVRFLQAEALKQLGRKNEAINVVLALMKQQRSAAEADQSNWAYWQQRTGNELANKLYLEGDFMNALEIYRRLADLDSNPTWRLPAWYQAGLIYERLKQPQKAGEVYGRIVEEGRKLSPENTTSNLAMVVEMAGWRQERLTWQTKAEQTSQEIFQGTSLSQ